MTKINSADLVGDAVIWVTNDKADCEGKKKPKSQIDTGIRHDPDETGTGEIRFRSRRVDSSCTGVYAVATK